MSERRVQPARPAAIITERSSLSVGNGTTLFGRTFKGQPQVTLSLYFNADHGAGGGGGGGNRTLKRRPGNVRKNRSRLPMCHRETSGAPTQQNLYRYMKNLSKKIYIGNLYQNLYLLSCSPALFWGVSFLCGTFHHHPINDQQPRESLQRPPSPANAPSVTRAFARHAGICRRRRNGGTMVQGEAGPCPCLPNQLSDIFSVHSWQLNGRDLPEDPLVMRRLRSPGPRTVTGGATVCCQSLESSEPIKRLGFLTAKQLTDNQSWV